MAAEDWFEEWLDCDGWVEDEWEEERADEAEKEHRRTCRGSRVRRINRETTEPFWGCSRFPECRWSRSMVDDDEYNL